MSKTESLFYVYVILWWSCYCTCN